MALGEVKNELRYLNRRRDIEILKAEARYMKKRENKIMNRCRVITET